MSVSVCVCMVGPVCVFTVYINGLWTVNGFLLSVLINCKNYLDNNFKVYVCYVTHDIACQLLARISCHNVVCCVLLCLIDLCCTCTLY